MNIPPDISIILPHYREPRSNAALRICLDCIVANTTVNYELLLAAAYDPQRDLYPLFNSLVQQASAEYVLFLNSDMFLAPNWAEPFMQARTPDVILAGVLVEPGAIGVSDRNVKRDFGMTPERFRRDEFEAYATSGAEIPRGSGWTMPSLHHRASFLSIGGFDTNQGRFPYDPVDLMYIDKWITSGRKTERVASYCYHLQHWSDKSEQDKEVRYAD